MTQSNSHAADLVVKNATVLPFDEEFSVLENCDIVVLDGRIAACGPGEAARWSTTDTLDGRDVVVTPGLCNGHTHSPETLARGLADTAPLGRWLETVWGRLDHLDHESIRLGILLCAAEMLHGGVTAVVDHFRQTPANRLSVDSAATSWLESGIRATVAVMVRDRNVPAWVKQPISCAEQVDMLRECTERWDGTEGRLRIAIGPSAPTRCSDELLRAAGALCDHYGIALQMHVDETRDEVALARSRFGDSAVRHLDRLGILGPHVSLAHCVWCGPEDLEILASTRSAVVHNPVSNLRLGSGRAPIERMRDRGVDVVIGTDGAASNDSQSVLESVKVAALLPRLSNDDPSDWISARQALSLATINAGRVFDMGDGRLAAGCRADFAAFERAALPFAPANDLHCQLAFAGGGVRARHVVVDGRVVLRNHEIVTFDEQRVLNLAVARGTPFGADGSAD